jgi:regulator of PEP synthase PpsR (kinase-PPPase family)
MANKKDLQSNFNSMFLKTEAPAKKESNEAQYGRICTIANLELMDKLRAIARKENMPIKDVLEAAMQLAVSSYEAKNGKVKLPNKGNAEGLF